MGPLTPEGFTSVLGRFPEREPLKATARYAEMGVAERYQYVAYEGGHAFRRDMREESYAWLDHWLTGTGSGSRICGYKQEGKDEAQPDDHQ